MKYAIVGSREFTDYNKFKMIVNIFKDIDMIISGGAIGTDNMAYRYSVENGITFVCHPPKPEDGYPRKFFRRNLRIIEMSEVVLAFPMGASTGTRHSISLAKRLNKKLFVFEQELS